MKTYRHMTLAALGSLLALVVASPARAVVEFDQDVTPDIIFGSGNANGSFTTDRDSGVELGLRGKLRFDENNLPQNTFNSNGDGSYTFQAGNPPTGFSFDPNNPTTPVWNFEWSINTDFDDSSGLFLDDLTYELSLDADPGPGTNFLTFDPINDVNPATSAVQWDHAIGTNATGNGSGTSIPNNTSDASGYASLIANNNVAQNSWNYEFFNGSGSPLEFFDPNDTGTYTIMLTAFNGANPVASSSIDTNVVPEPATAGLVGLAVCGLGLAVRRRRRNGR